MCMTFAKWLFLFRTTCKPTTKNPGIGQKPPDISFSVVLGWLSFGVFIILQGTHPSQASGVETRLYLSQGFYKD